MIHFEITGRTAQAPAPPKKKQGRLDPRWAMSVRVFTSMSLTALLFVTLLNILHTDYAFVLLPTLLSMLTLGNRRYSFALILNSTLLYVLLSFCLSLAYYAFLSAFVLLTHFQADTDHIILVAATFACSIICEPVRLYLQEKIEQRFNTHNREVRRALEAFTSTLREEIDLELVRERFLKVIQQTMQPHTLALWVRVPAQAETDPASVDDSTGNSTVTVAEDDPFVLYALKHHGVLDLTRLRLTSPLLDDLQQQANELVLPLASQGELIGLLVLGPRIANERYRRLARVILGAVLFFSLIKWLLLLVLGPRMDDDIYTPQDRAMLSALAPQVAPALRVAQMVQEQQRQVRERERIEQELRTAQAIQQAFLPRDIPALAGWQLVPYYQPAREVGGDFYDVIALDNGQLGLIIGDVTGKGVPAALVMATVLTMLRSTARTFDSPAQILELVNEQLAAEIPAGVFVTCFYVLLDPSSGRLRYANAGHEAPYRQQNEAASELWATGMPLGMLPGSRYEEFEAVLAPGESLLFYSDGLVEAHNPSGEMFGFPRLQALLSKPARETALIDLVLTHLHGFTGDKWEQEDDVTLLTLQRTGSAD